jgi:hypothetical protein
MVTFTDVLGDQQFNLFASSVSQYRTLSLSWLNLERRFNWMLQGYSQTQFYYGQVGGVFYDPAFSGIIDRDLAVATRTMRGGTAYGIYPFNRYRRMEFYGGVNQYVEEFADQGLEQYSQQYQEQIYGRQLFNNGYQMPLGAAFVQETTVFREFGPLTGSTMRLAYEVAPKIGNSLSRQTMDGDARKYYRLGATGLLALRARGFKSWGPNPSFMYFGGNSELRGYDYLSFAGQNAFFLNAELRFPLIEAMATPIGILGGVRAAFFANLGGASWSPCTDFRCDQDNFKVFANNTEVHRPVVGYTLGQPVLGDPIVVDGTRFRDARGSYGISLMTFALGFPIHFDWSWRTLLNREWEDVVYSYDALLDGWTGRASEWFRRPKFSVWIGYDF